MKRTALKKNGFKNVFHIDAYRVKSPRELSLLGIKEIFQHPEHIVLVEWADKIPRLLPKKKIGITFAYGRTPDVRRIKKT
jgi:tRNA A37 threonylcarbamoyladenosine biosynthesis protein TsaE